MKALTNTTESVVQMSYRPTGCQSYTE